MSKLFNYYVNDVDYTWYNSSNIKYSECIDKEGELKTLNVVFSNGTQYQYVGLTVQDYLLFRDSDSQGKALNKYIKAKGYEFKKLDDANLDDINNEYLFRTSNGIELEHCDDTIKLYDTNKRLLCELDLSKEVPIEDILAQVLTSVGYKIKQSEKTTKNLTLRRKYLPI